MPAGTLAAALTDSVVKLVDGFLQNLGRPARESACECERMADANLAQSLLVLTSKALLEKIANANE